MIEYYSAMITTTIIINQPIDACDNIDESQNNYAKYKKPDKIECILFDSIYV